MTGTEVAMECGVVLLGAWNVYIHLLLDPLRKDNESLKTSLEKTEKTAVNGMNDLKAEFGSRIAGIHSDYKMSQERYDSRVSILERSYLSRAEHSEFRAEIVRALGEVGEKVSRSVENLSSKVDHFSERLVKVEARGE